MPRTLIVKFGAIGDAVMLIPAVRQLHLAGHTIDWVCGSGILPILKLYPWINPILADDKAILIGSPAAKLKAIASLWPALRKHSYDLAATLYYDPRYRLITLPVRARRKLMLSHTDRGSRILPSRHHTDEFTRILLDLPDRVRPESTPPLPPDLLPASPLPPPLGTRIVMAPAGARNMLAEAVLRRWPEENYVALAEQLLAKGFEVVLIGGPDDTWVQPQFAHLPVIDIIGTLRLPETVAVMDSAAVVVTHDTGPLHLAGITRASVVALFGPTDPHTFMPRRPGVTAIWGGEGFACRPCYDGHSFASCPANDCMRQIPVAQVFEAVLTSLAEPDQPARIFTPITQASLTLIAPQTLSS
jgi:heptosyltransferase-2